MAGVWTVTHKEHNGSAIALVRPENLTFLLQLGNSGPCTIEYELSRSHPAMEIELIGPYRTDFELRLDDELLMAGMHTDFTINTEEEHVSIAGKDWIHYLELRHWPFNPQAPNDFRKGIPTTTITNPPYGFAYHVSGRDSSLILTDILDMVLAQPYSLNMSYSFDPVGRTPNYDIPLGDTETVMSKFQTLSEEEPGGFDFWADPGKNILLAAPGLYDRDTVFNDPYGSTIWVFDADDAGKENNPLLSVEFSNHGPEYTHLLGVGSGLTTHVGRALGQITNQKVYRRMDGTRDFGQVPNQTRVNNLTQKWLTLGVQPRHDIKITVNPDGIPSFWQIFRPGNPILLRIQMEGEFVHSPQEIVDMRATVDLNGNAIVDMGLQQIYATNDAGTVQG